MTFYLKYRPKNLDELDLKDVSASLGKILKSDNIPHAFLFAGPKGTGKTSAARILAKIINCTSKDPPCDNCEQCLSIAKGNNLDVIEMDGASNRGIDDIRILKDAIKLSPSLAKKKIYIIDEAHMLTTEASNALLKTLEEPPEHVMFILATTNPEKLIDTVKSRATLIKFRKANSDEIVRSLKRVVDGEKLKISDEILEKIAKDSNGAFRDAVKMLEQINLEGQEVLSKGILSESEFFDDLFSKKRDECMEYISRIVEEGNSVEHLIKDSLSKIQSLLLSGDDKLTGLAELLIEANSQMKDSPIEELPLEIAVIKWCSKNESGDLNLEYGKELKVEKLSESPQVVVNTEGVLNADFDNEEIWQKILTTIKPVNASVEALLRSSKPLNYDGSTLTLGVYYKFHKERLEETVHRKIVEEVATKVLNSSTRINCTLLEAPLIAPLTEDHDQDIIKVAEEIFS